jgi:prevent-host-death family protein
MAKTVNIFEAKTNLSKLIARAEKGEEIVIARAGKAVARLTKLEPIKKRIRFGGLKGKIWVADDFDAPLPDAILSEFEDGPIFPPERRLSARSGAAKSQTKRA